jgi:hypothetical protein
MFVRFRQTKRKLQVSLCEARWTPTGPRQEHIAQLGSVSEPQTVAGRITFWKQLDERLARLANRVSPAERDRFREVIATRIPASTAGEVRQFEELQAWFTKFSKDPHAKLLTELREDLIPVVCAEAVAAIVRAERSATRKLVGLQRAGRTRLLEQLKVLSLRTRVSCRISFCSIGSSGALMQSLPAGRSTRAHSIQTVCRSAR